MTEPMIRGESNVVGLIPAAGQAKRIAPLPLSKELYPIGFQIMNGRPEPRPKVVCHYLLEKLHLAGITEAFIVIRQGKWDIPAYFGDGTLANMHLGYLIMREPFGPPFTLDQAYHFLRNKLVAFGFPDILFDPEDVFKQLLDLQEACHADVVLALFPAHNPRVMDMVDMDKNGQVRAVSLKPGRTKLHFTWLCAVWTPVFTHFMHEHLQTYRRTVSQQDEKEDELKAGECTVGAVILAAIIKGLKVYGVAFPDGKYVDIGTPEDLVKSVELFGRGLPIRTPYR